MIPQNMTLVIWRGLAGAPLSSLIFFFQPNLWVLAELEITFTLYLALAQLKQESLCLETVGWGLKVENIKSRQGEPLKEKEFHGNKNSLVR